MIKGGLLAIMVSALFHSAFAQTSEDGYADRYAALKFTEYDVIGVAESAGWQPKKAGIFKGSFNLFETTFLKVCRADYRNLQQMHIDGTYYCSKNHEYLFSKYNRVYKPISHEMWEANCPLLYTLMHLDEEGEPDMQGSPISKPTAPSTQSQIPVQSTPFTLANSPLAFARKWIGKYSFDVKAFQHPVLRKRLGKLLGNKLNLLTEFDVTTAIEEESDCVIIEGCKPHFCPQENFIVVLDIKRNILSVGIVFMNYNIHKYEVMQLGESREVHEFVSDWDEANRNSK